MTSPRTVFYLNESMFVPGVGYVPSVVIEGKPGHTPLTNPGTRDPISYGSDFKIARAACEQANAENGFSWADVLEVVASSMAATNGLSPRKRAEVFGDQEGDGQ